MHKVDKCTSLHAFCVIKHIYSSKSTFRIISAGKSLLHYIASKFLYVYDRSLPYFILPAHATGVVVEIIAIAMATNLLRQHSAIRSKTQQSY